MLGAFLLQIILITLNAVFASAEIAVISLNETKLKQEAKNGDVRAERLMSLTSQHVFWLRFRSQLPLRGYWAVRLQRITFQHR